ncbi:MAG: hypothetical protein GY854_08325 [Deltaproteobacteria bacterium]|nr:hypothetical protein [Deltaproteobacteria bacterium]
MTARRCFVALFVTFAVVGCKRTYGRQACRIENEMVLAETRDVPIAIAVEAVESGRFVAAWSVEDATWVAELNARGSMDGPVLRLDKNFGKFSYLSKSPKAFWPEDERSSIESEHLTIVALGQGRVAVPMLERPKSGRPGGAYVTFLSIAGASEPNTVYLGSAGEYAGCIAAIKIDKELIIAWHEGMLSSSRILLARVQVPRMRVDKSAGISGDSALSSPALAAAGGRALLVWSETVHGKKETRSLVRAASLSTNLELGERKTVASGRFLDSAPSIARVGSLFGIVFRDDADRDDTPEFYFSLIDANGTGTLPPKRISQADGWRGPSLIYKAPHLVSAAIRSFQRNLLIGVNRFDKAGVKLGGEFQVYADKTDFTRVDLAVSDKNMMMVYGEDRRGAGRVLAGRITCSKER